MWLLLAVSLTCLLLASAAAVYVFVSLKTPVKVEKARRMKDYPMTYPRGWFKLMNSDDLKPGDIKQVEALGQHFAVFRGRDNKKVAVLDAFCIHLGANLTVGGKVEGDCVQCPFHLWEWNTEGKCTKIPYQKQIPERAQQPTYPSMEYYGLILVYYDRNNPTPPADQAPPYLPPSIPNLDGGDFVYAGRYNRSIGMHLVEIAENSADFNHFETLHGHMAIPYTTIPIPGVTIVHKATAEYGVGSAEPHLIQFTDTASVRILGKDIPHTTALAEITYVGPSSLMIFQFNTEAGKIVLFQTHLPTDPLNCDTEFVWYCEKKVWRMMAWYVVGNWISQWRNDVAIWNNKTFMRRPFLVKGDGPIMRLRRWVFQFYDLENVVYDEDETTTNTSATPTTTATSPAKSETEVDGASCVKRNVATAGGCNKGVDW